MNTRVLEIRKGVLNKNDELARGLRDRFVEAGVLTVNLVSSPGTGKTAFLERTLTALRESGARVAALVGDLETDNDARRLAASGAPVRQINTHRCCHLEAAMIAEHLEGWDLSSLDFLFIENVGNLVCPASYDLGEKLRIALLSVAEGEDKPLKYPGMFNSADIAVISRKLVISIARPRVQISTRFAPGLRYSRYPPNAELGWLNGSIGFESSGSGLNSLRRRRRAVASP